MANIPPIITRRSKRLGRGYGSGKGGHTSGRGQKGQKARRSIGILFEGFKTKKSLLRRLPMQRGKGKLKPHKKAIGINVEFLNILNSGATVNVESLVKAGIVTKEAFKLKVKILGSGELSKKLTVEIPTTKTARTKIEAVGGKVNVA